MRVCGDVEIFRAPAQQQVAHTAANEIGVEVTLLEAIEHLERVGINVAPRNRVLGAGNDDGLNHELELYGPAQGLPEPKTGYLPPKSL